MPAYIHTDRGASFMSKELRDFLANKGIACSRTTSYNPSGNGQVERYNGVIWKTVTTALRTRGLPEQCWQSVLPDALHAIRSLLCTATNSTPHERLFNYVRRSSAGATIPSWLCEPGPVLLKRQVRACKSDPLVDEVELIQANPQYAYVRYPDGREDTVSIKRLAPTGSDIDPQVRGDSFIPLQTEPLTPEATGISDETPSSIPVQDNSDGCETLTPDPQTQTPQHTEVSSEPRQQRSEAGDEPRELRRSSRVKRPPLRYAPS